MRPSCYWGIVLCLEIEALNTSRKALEVAFGMVLEELAVICELVTSAVKKVVNLRVARFIVRLKEHCSQNFSVGIEPKEELKYQFHKALESNWHPFLN